MLKKLLFICAMLATVAQAQKPANYTLEEVMPGGKNYQKMSPKGMPELSWWGNHLILRQKENIRLYTEKGKGEVLVTLAEINEALQKQDTALRCASLQYAVPSPKGDELLLPLSRKRFARYDRTSKSVVSLLSTNAKATSFDHSTAGNVAYTVGNLLFVATKDGKQQQVDPTEKETDGIVFGQSVHQNEFGIRKGTYWSPSGMKLAFYRMDERMVKAFPQVNHTGRISVHQPQRYPMAGETTHKVQVGIYDPATASTLYLRTPDPTDRYFTNIAWSPDERSLYVIELNRDQNHTQLVRYDATTGERMQVLYEERHPKYVEPQTPIVFLPWDDNKFIYQSERDGFNHLYLFDLGQARKGDERKVGESTYREEYAVKQLTVGSWVVKDFLGFHPLRKTILYTSTEVSPLQVNAYEVSLNGKRTPLDNGKGIHRVNLSADGSQFIDTYSSHDIPLCVELGTVGKKKNAVLHTSQDPLAEQYQLPEISIGTIKAADGKTDLYYRLVKPQNFDVNKQYPAVIYVYGGPHAQLVKDTRFYGAGGFDLYMAAKGYVMLTVDGRGSDSRGLAFENLIHRQLGTEEAKDQMQGIKLLRSLGFVDMNKIGVHGWSFGGFMTINLMETFPDVFKVGVSGGPVIDWKYYEAMYGERYMDTPQSNPEGYQNADLKQRVQNIRGRLKVIIGGMDPVCLPQHSQTFLRSAIDHGVQVDYFIYPEDGHNMFGRDRVHLYEQVCRYFFDFLH